MRDPIGASASLPTGPALEVGRLAGSAGGLERVRPHVAVVIPVALLRGLRCFATGHSGAFMRMAAAIGAGHGEPGYLTGRAGQARRIRSETCPVDTRQGPNHPSNT